MADGHHCSQRLGLWRASRGLGIQRPSSGVASGAPMERASHLWIRSPNAARPPGSARPATSRHPPLVLIYSSTSLEESGRQGFSVTVRCCFFKRAGARTLKVSHNFRGHHCRSRRHSLARRHAPPPGNWPQIESASRSWRRRRRQKWLGPVDWLCTASASHRRAPGASDAARRPPAGACQNSICRSIVVATAVVRRRRRLGAGLKDFREQFWR